jgi:tetratricopeptide (TPR) repeat protein
MAEKSVDALPRDLRMLYTRGADALARENFDYAIDLFLQVLAREPAVFECRKALRTAQLKKAAGGSGFFKRMAGKASLGPLIGRGQMALRTNPAEALTLAEQILSNDPSSSAGHRLAVEAAHALQLPRTAVMSLEMMFRYAPTDRNLGIQLAKGFAEIGEVGRGVNILSELYRLYPNDTDLAQTLKNLSARETMTEGGYEELSDGTGSYRDILKDKEEAVSLEQQNRQMRDEDTAGRLIKEYEARLQNEPRNLKLLRDLAELYTEKKDFDRALEYYSRLKASDIGSDAGVSRAISDLVARRIDHQISLLDPGEPDYPERLAQLQLEKETYLLTEAQKRAEQFPTDLQIRYELGVLYFHAGKIGEAIQEFQKAQNNPHRKVASLNYLAQCFAKRRMFDLAARTLQNAIKEKLVFDDEKKELVYNLGTVLESMGKKEEAIEQLKLIYELDIGYKDVAAKVDAYYKAEQG